MLSSMVILPDWRERIPSNIAIGLDTTKPELLERRKDWNTRTPGAMGITYGNLARDN